MRTIGWRHGSVLFLALLVVGVAVGAPPTVVRAEPDNGEVGVDPATDRIRVVFDQPMRADGYSIVGGGPSLPDITGDIRWVGDRSVVIPVKLRPDHEYRLSINSDRFKNFRNRAGEAAVPYPIVFTTGANDTGTNDASVRGTNARAVDRAIGLLTSVYAHRDKLGVDWADALGERRGALEGAADPLVFARMLGTILARNKDKHVWLNADGTRVGSYINPVSINADRGLRRRVVPAHTDLNRIVSAGRFPDGTGYLAIDSWSREHADEIGAAFEVIWSMHDARALIIDVRLNDGGSETLARQVAGCFVERPAPYAKHETVDPDAPGGFGAAQTRTLMPSTRRPRFRGEVAVLTGPAVMSSAEAFVLMMRAAGATIVGQPTQGSSGNPRPYDLGNGVTLYLPSWRAMTLDGRRFEGLGIDPDVLVETDPDDFSRTDPVLDRALGVLRARP